MIEVNTATNPLTLEEYLDLEYPFVVTVDPDYGGYVIDFPDLPGCVTQAETLDEIPHMAEDARAGWIESAFEQGLEIPLPSFPETYSGKFNLRLPRSLHRKLAESAERDGVSLNQFVVSLLSEALTIHRTEERQTKIEGDQTSRDPVADVNDPRDNDLARIFENPRSIFSDPE